MHKVYNILNTVDKSMKLASCFIAILALVAFLPKAHSDSNTTNTVLNLGTAQTVNISAT